METGNGSGEHAQVTLCEGQQRDVWCMRAHEAILTATKNHVCLPSFESGPGLFRKCRRTGASMRYENEPFTHSRPIAADQR